jgi:hypothetical protein
MYNFVHGQIASGEWLIPWVVPGQVCGEDRFSPFL